MSAPAIARSGPGFADALRGELALTRRRIVPWVSIAVWAFCIVVFAYLVSYLTTVGSEWYTAEQQEAAVQAMLPSGVGHYILASLPLYAAPQFAVLGAIIGASDYSRGTLGTIMARFPRRAPFIAARMLNLVALGLAAAFATVVTSALASSGVALAQDARMAFPPMSELVAALAGVWLIAVTFILIGFALGTLTRSMLAAVAIAAGWTLGVESLAIGMLGPVVPAIEAIQGFLPVGATSSLAAGFVPEGQHSIPAVVAATSPAVAVMVLVAWIAIAGGAAAWALRGRDLA